MNSVAMNSAAGGWPESVQAQARALRSHLQPAIDGFLREHQLPENFSQVIDDYYLPLAVWLAQRHLPGKTLVVGLCGGQGSGKSTLCDFLQIAWREGMQLSAMGLSLDDFYLTHAERRQLAEEVHPLLATRGVPGTHDVDLGLRTIERLRHAGAETRTFVPRFDKSTDDRAPGDRCRHWHGPLDILLFEGWCLGARPWSNTEPPINALERKRDPKGIWRNYINAQLSGPYRKLFAQLDALMMLKVPDMECVLEWRTLQERQLRARSGRGMSDEQVAEFVQHYERVTRSMLEEMPQRADCVFELGRDHNIQGMRLKTPVKVAG